jgi:hypothetical protein
MLGAVRVRAGIVAAVAVLTACGSSATSSGTSLPPPRCGPVDAPTLASSSEARVYSSHGSVYGCSFVGHRAFRLGTTARSIHESRVEPVVVAGDAAAYGLVSFGVDTVSASVVVRRLTDGKQLANFAVTRSAVPEGVESVRSLALKSNGAVGWIGLAHSIVGGREVIEVHAVDAPASPPARASANRLLDSGAQVAPASLRLHGSTLTWKHGAATRHAALH